MAGFLLFENVLRGATVLSETTLTNYSISNMLDGKTASQAGFEGGSVDRDTDFDLGVATTVDCFCVARHNGGDLTSLNILIYGSSDNTNWTSVAGINTLGGSSENYYKTFTSVSYRYYRVRVLASGGNGYIADLSLGSCLELERSQKHGFVKPEWADGDKVIANVTRGQNLAGLTIDEGLKRCKFDLYYYSEAFFTRWLEFTAYVKQYPGYILWDDNEALFFCWPTKAIPKPSYAKNIQGYYGVKLDMSGITS